MANKKPSGLGRGLGALLAGLADPPGGLLLGHVIGLNQRLVARGLLHGVQILPLEVVRQTEVLAKKLLAGPAEEPEIPEPPKEVALTSLFQIHASGPFRLVFRRARASSRSFRSSRP